MLAFVGVFMIVFVGVLLLIGMIIVGTTWEFIVQTAKVILVIVGVMMVLFFFQGVMIMLGL